MGIKSNTTTKQLVFSKIIRWLLNISARGAILHASQSSDFSTPTMFYSKSKFKYLIIKYLHIPINIHGCVREHYKPQIM